MTQESAGDFMNVIFETHSTSFDNEAGIASGHNDVELSELGIEQAKALGARHADTVIAAVFCSDLRRSYRTAEIAFSSRPTPIYRDRRLRECDYGIFNGALVDVVEDQRASRVDQPFPHGESYRQVAARVKEFLLDVFADLAESHVLIIGHRATYYSLEHWLTRAPLLQAMTAPWRWQPGWTYQLDARRSAELAHSPDHQGPAEARLEQQR